MANFPENITAENIELTSNELERYSRHLVIPEVGKHGQLKLKAASVLILGAGGLGSPISMYLAAAGVGRIGIVDFDELSYSNLQRQVLYSTNDVGHLKTELAKERLNEINPNIEITLYNERLTRDNALDILRDYDIIADGTDNFATRYLVNDACVILGKPFVYGSILRFDGQVSFFEPVHGPCYRCLYPEPPAPGDTPNCADGGVMGVLPGIIGSLQANEVIKFILGKGEMLNGRLLLIDALNMKFREVKFAKDPACPVCGSDPVITELIDYEQFCKNINSKENMTEHNEWEITVEEYKQRVDSGEKVYLLDIREPHERDISHIGGVLIPMSELPERMNELPQDKDTEIIVYCRTGNRSHHVTLYLKDNIGYSNVKNLLGGIHAWHDRIDPEVKKY
ncbi:MAG: molybdopterin-synthase adenylyltransferase MoeB [Ignavibacteria bacterium]|nr:molybdopterin-synthase adenylyltransferase MoeB [Ignavibacteria bacterium]